MYYWLIDSGGIMPIIQAESMADELVADSGAAVSPSVRITVRPNGPLRIEGLNRAGRRERRGVGPDGQADDLAVPLRALVQSPVLRRHPPPTGLEVRSEPDSR